MVLTEIIEDYEKNVQSFNEGIVRNLKVGEPLEMKEIRDNASQVVKLQVASIVDMAKCEALDCRGEEEAATRWQNNTCNM
jgi:hypothetical protein